MGSPEPNICLGGSDVSEDGEKDFSRNSERFDSGADESQQVGTEFCGSVWDTLPDIPLQHIFGHLSDIDRSRAAQVCHRWHQIMDSPCLWRNRCFHLNGRPSTYISLSEYKSVVGYISSRGAFLEKLEVIVDAPNTTVLARRLNNTICGLFENLIRVRAPIRFLSLVNLELRGNSWTKTTRTSVVASLITFLQRGASKLKYLSLKGMQNSTSQGLRVLLTIMKRQRDFSPHGNLFSLDLRNFFYTHNPTVNSRMPSILQELQGLAYLGLNYHCLSDELIMALCQSHGGGRRNGRNENTLQTLSLTCTRREPRHQMVCSHSWETLVSSSPDLKVHISVEHVVNTDHLANILLPKIPVRKFSLTDFDSSAVTWSVKPLLRDILPLYQQSLQVRYLTLDVRNPLQSMDIELLELVSLCKHLVDLRVWSFLDVHTVRRLLHMRLTQNFSLNKIEVRIYTETVNSDQKRQLDHLLSAYKQLFPPELEVLASPLLLL